MEIAVVQSKDNCFRRGVYAVWSQTFGRLRYCNTIQILALSRHGNMRDLVRIGVLGASERRVLEAYLKGERVKGYNVLLWRIRKLGLKTIIEDCEKDLTLLRKLTNLIEKPK